MNGTHVVFGAAGSLGAAIVGKLAAEGKPVRAVVRSREKAAKILHESPETVQGDALNAQTVQELCHDARTIYHCINVPYQRWTKVMPKVTNNILTGAIEAKASLLFPGNVYGYGPFQKIPATEDHPHAATSRKGRLRNAIESKLLDAHKAGEVSVVIPRFPDYYGPNVTNRLFGGIFKAAIAGKKANWIGKLDVPHDFVYIEDAAAASILLGSNREAHGQVWHVPGPGPITGRQFLETAFKTAGTEPRIGTLSGGIVRVASLVSTDAREVRELLYEFEEPLVLDGTKFTRAFPAFKYTPDEEGIRQTVRWFRETGAAWTQRVT